MQTDHASNPARLAASLRALAPAFGSVRPAMSGIVAAGLRAVVIDAGARETRPRLLSRSDRRDLAAVIKRTELVAAGVDLLIRAEAWADPAESDRAVAAGLDAIRLAADLRSLDAGIARPVVCVSLPAEGTDTAAGALADEGDRLGVAVSMLGENGAESGSQRTARSPRLSRLAALGDSPGRAPEQLLKLGASLAQLRIDASEPDALASLGGCIAAMSVAAPEAGCVLDAFGGADRAQAERTLVRCAAAWRSAAV